MPALVHFDIVDRPVEIVGLDAALGEIGTLAGAIRELLSESPVPVDRLEHLVTTLGLYASGLGDAVNDVCEIRAGSPTALESARRAEQQRHAIAEGECCA